MLQNSNSRFRSVGIWATSSPTKASEVKLGLSRIQKLGIKFYIPNFTKKYTSQKESLGRPFLAGSDKNKINALRELVTLQKKYGFRDVLICRGGYGSVRLLKHLKTSDWNFFKKIRIWGFSDLTTLQNAIFAKTGTPWVHSPMLTSPAFYNPNLDEKKIWERLTDLNSKNFFNFTLKSNWKKSFHRPLAAPIIGGNLACFMALQGSDFDPLKTKKFFLFLEDIGEAPHRLDRLLNQLSLSRLFKKNCLGVILGDFTECKNHKDIISKWGEENQVPLFWGLKTGHERPNLPIAMGITVTIRQISDGKFDLEMPNFKFGC